LEFFSHPADHDTNGITSHAAAGIRGVIGKDDIDVGKRQRFTRHQGAKKPCLSRRQPPSLIAHRIAANYVFKLSYSLA